MCAIVQKEANMQVELLSYGAEVCDKDWCAAWDTDFHHKIYYCTGGTAFYVLDGKRIYLKKNHIYIFPLLLKCEITHQPDAPFEVIWFHVGGSQPLAPKVCEICADSGVFSLITPLFKDAVNNNDDNVTQSLINYFFEMCVYHKKLGDYIDENIAAALHFMHDNLHKDIDNKMLSEIVSYNKNYFIALFKQNTGLTPHRYLRILRLNTAKMHLGAGLSLKQTAERCGFACPNMLSRDIKTHFGISATDIKKQGLRK